MVEEWADSDTMLLPRASADVAASETWAPAGLRRFVLGRQEDTEPDRTIAISELPIEEGGIGSRLWDSALALASFAALNGAAFKGKRVLELGSGTGFGGLAIAAAGASSVVLSDFPFGNSSLLSGSVDPQPVLAHQSPLLQNLRENARINGGHVQVESLDWHSPSVLGEFEMVVASDCVYTNEVVPSLVDCILRHTGAEGEVVVIAPSARTGLSNFVVALERGLAGSGRALRSAKFTLHELAAANWPEPSVDGWQGVGCRVPADPSLLEQAPVRKVLQLAGRAAAARALGSSSGGQRPALAGSNVPSAQKIQHAVWRSMPWMVEMTAITVVANGEASPDLILRAGPIEKAHK
jgi:predicted nicotinamide N-methyase